ATPDARSLPDGRARSGGRGAVALHPASRPGTEARHLPAQRCTGVLATRRAPARDHGAGPRRRRPSRLGTDGHRRPGRALGALTWVHRLASRYLPVARTSAGGRWADRDAALAGRLYTKDL